MTCPPSLTPAQCEKVNQGLKAGDPKAIALFNKVMKRKGVDVRAGPPGPPL